jgi:hypothetical protein
MKIRQFRKRNRQDGRYFWCTPKGKGGDSMTNKKDLIIAVLATFCLTATLFMVTSTRSQTPIGTYDPTVDINHDGSVNILDAILLANHFSTSGDPTISVYVTNTPKPYGSVPIGWYNISWSNYTCDFGIDPYGIYCEGYSRLFLHMCLVQLSYSGPGNTTIYLDHIVWNSSGVNVGEDHFTPEICSVTVDHWPQQGSLGPQTAIMKIEIKAENIEQLTLKLFSTVPSGWAYIYFIAYMRNE